MPHADWRSRAGTVFTCEKQPATGTRGMVVTNHPLASAAGAEMLAAGGNAIDAAIAAFFTLTVVEPMMVGVLGGGMAHIRLADGTHHVHRRPEHRSARHRPDHLHARSEAAPGTMDTIGRKNAVGPTAVAAPGNLMGWCEALRRFGTFSLADVMEPAIRHASRGFRVTPYLHECVTDCAADMARDKEIARALSARTARRSRPARAWSPATMPRRCAPSLSEGPDVAVRRRARPALRRPHGAVRRLYLTLRGPDPLSHHRPRSAARHLSRLRDRRTAAAVLRPAAHHPDAEHPGGLRHRRARLRHRPTRCTCWPRC